MIANVPQTSLQRFGLDRISVGQVAIGPIRIGRFVLNDFDLRASSGEAQLRNFRVTIALAMKIEWRIFVPLPLVPDIDERGTIDLGKPSFTVPLGDVKIPALQSFTVSVDSLTATNVAAAASPLTNLQLGSAVAEQIRARNIAVPSQGFQIAGLTIGSARAEGIAVPGANVEDVTIGRVKGEALPMGSLTLTNLNLPPATVSDIRSENIDVRAVQVGKVFHADLGILELSLTVTPEARGQIEQLLIGRVTASTTIGRIEMTDVVAPYEFLNLTLSQIGIETIEIPTLSVA